MFEDTTKNRIARWIAGDISISEDPSASIKRWRKKFEIKQNTLADKLEISPSVISDYESGRRESPGAKIIKKIVEALIKLDDERGGRIIQAFADRFEAHLPPQVVLGMRDFEKPTSGNDLLEVVEGEPLANRDLLKKRLFGYTVIDGPKAVIELSSEDFKGLYGATSERALIFTRVSTGRSPLVAIKVRGITPGAVVLHGKVAEPDKVGVKIAQDLKVPLILSRESSVDSLLENLQKALP